jgi:hypothetical protein
MHPVDSSAIEAVGYEEARRELYVRFVSHETYAYPGADKSLYQDFLAAPSKGRYFAERIRPAFPKYRKL